MNCKKWEQQIYLYDELTLGEKQRLNDHLLGCESCRKMMKTAQFGMNTILRAASARVELKNPEQLTRSIMSKIRPKQVERTESLISVLLDSVFTRYAFTIASLVFAVFFIIESNRVETAQPAYSNAISTNNPVTLSTRSFLQNFNNQSKNPKTLSSLYECAKSENCNSEVMKAFRKRYKS